jgi:hypothetical protein
MTCLSPLGDSGLPYQCIYFNLFQSCIRCRSTTRSGNYIKGTRPFFVFNLFILIYLNRASVAAPQQGVAAPDGTPDFYFCNLRIFIYLNGASGAAPKQGIRAPDGAAYEFF